MLVYEKLSSTESTMRAPIDSDSDPVIDPDWDPFPDFELGSGSGFYNLDLDTDLGLDFGLGFDLDLGLMTL